MNGGRAIDSYKNLSGCYLYGNPLNEQSLEEYLPLLRKQIEYNDFDEILREYKVVKD